MISGQCLCGSHRFEVDGALQANHHCHCGYCRKHHGSAFATMVGVSPDHLRWERGEAIRYESSPGTFRESCATCGTPLPLEIEGMPTFVPAGCLGDFAEPIEFHIFTGSKAPWYEIRDALPAFEAYPPGIEAGTQAAREPVDPPGGVRGSCLCGDVAYVIEGDPITARHCHCTRCRRGRGAAHASNLVVSADVFRFTRGEQGIRSYRVPEAKYFTQCFCGRCGATVPTLDLDRRIAIVPMGSLDDEAPIGPQEHIWTSAIPSWSGIHDDLPRREGPPA